MSNISKKRRMHKAFGADLMQMFGIDEATNKVKATLEDYQKAREAIEKHYILKTDS